MRIHIALTIGAMLAVAFSSMAMAQWSPHRQFSIAEGKCAQARTALDKDECQYLAENLIEALQDCARRRGGLAGDCASMLPAARQMLQDVNSDPVLLEHRRRQWNQQNQPYIGPQGPVPAPSPGRTCVPSGSGWYCY